MENKPENKLFNGSDCPICHSDGKSRSGFLVKRNGKFGEFLGCNRYPICKFSSPLSWKPKVGEPIEEYEKLNWNNLVKDNCPKCGKKLHLKLIVGRRSTGKDSYNRVVRCYSVNCDFKIMSKKLEKMRSGIIKRSVGMFFPMSTKRST
jgi:hypothetical protein